MFTRLQRLTAASIAGMALVAASCAAPPPPPAQRTFPTPDAAVRTLIDLVKAGKLDDLMPLFGPDGKEVAASSDPVTGRRNREVFIVAATEGWELVEHGADKRVLVIGNEKWPFPVPLTRDRDGWRFDTAAGKEEIIARRIGRNELAVIQLCHTYVTAQRVYAQRAHDGKRTGLYAQMMRSDPGRQNGLYWPVKQGERRSPLGDLVAAAAAEGHALDEGGKPPSSFNGYFFKILTAQGPNASGGARNYIVKGEMSGGFALVAWPAEYDVTGVMTFVVNQDGVVHESDRGPDADGPKTPIALYDPDPSWTPVR
jgi:hypothetical protein